MKLSFDTYKKGKFFGVNVYMRAPQIDLFDELDDTLYAREYLDEAQYDRMIKWCETIFKKAQNPMRARRMAYADFWFQAQSDRDWFMLHWSGVDSSEV